MQSLRGGVYAIETARLLAAEKQYDALIYEGLLLSGKCLADQIGVPSIIGRFLPSCLIPAGCM